jgi:hypothetical protein
LLKAVNPQKNVQPEALTKLIEASKSTTISLINCDAEFIEKLVKIESLNYTFEIQNLTRAFHTRKVKVSSAIFNFRSLADFAKLSQLFNQQSTQGILFNGHFVVIFEDATISDMEQMFIRFWRIFVYNVDVITASANNISLYTFKPFVNDFACGNTKPMKINEFDINSMQWRSDQFFPKKFKNLHECPLQIGGNDNAPGYFSLKVKNQIFFTGIDVDLINGFGEKLNFKPVFRSYQMKTGAIFMNKTATGLLELVYKNELDVIMGTISLQQSRTDYVSETMMLYTDKMILVVPPPSLISSLMKIVLPFHVYSWIAIGVVMMMVCVVIVTLKYLPRVFHNYVVGVSVKTSFLNVWNLLLGGSQAKLPRPNFPRFLLANFLLFTLIIRTLYLGAFFGILKSDISAVELLTIDEFIEQDFTFNIYESLLARLIGTKYLNK